MSVPTNNQSELHHDLSRVWCLIPTYRWYTCACRYLRMRRYPSRRSNREHIYMQHNTWDKSCALQRCLASSETSSSVSLIMKPRMWKHSLPGCWLHDNATPLIEKLKAMQRVRLSQTRLLRAEWCARRIDCIILYQSSWASRWLPGSVRTQIQY